MQNNWGGVVGDVCVHVKEMVGWNGVTTPFGLSIHNRNLSYFVPSHQYFSNFLEGIIITHLFYSYDMLELSLKRRRWMIYAFRLNEMLSQVPHHTVLFSHGDLLPQARLLWFWVKIVLFAFLSLQECIFFYNTNYTKIIDKLCLLSCSFKTVHAQILIPRYKYK